MLGSQRQLFELPEDVAYLNCAYLSPLLKTAAAVGREGLDRKLRPWQIVGKDFLDGPEKARALFGRLIGAQAEDIALVPSASYGIAVAANNLPLAAGQQVVVMADEFPSNVEPWRLKAAAAGAVFTVVDWPQDGNWTPAVLAAISPGTAIVALPQCHWTDGTLVDLVAVAKRTREVGAALVLDLTQTLGAWPFDLAAVDPDYAVCAGYKWLFGPYSVGFLYVAPRRRGDTPLEYNYYSRSVEPAFERLVGRKLPFAVEARRFDVGECANFALLPVASAGLQQLIDWGVDNIAATLRPLTEEIAERGAAMGLSSHPARYRAAHYIGLRFPGGLPHGAAAKLAERGVHVSQRGDALRVTPHVYNSRADVDRLFHALADLAPSSTRLRN